jgi:hypothetical protein
MADNTILVPPLGLALGLVCMIFGLRFARLQKLVENLPTCKTTGVFIGVVELKGTAESENPFLSYLAETDCVFYDWKVEESWSRQVTETYRDAKGNTQTRTRTESGWTTVAYGGEKAPFYLKDSESAVLIQPDGAKLEPLNVFDITCRPADPLYYTKGPATSISNSDHVRRFIEIAIPIHAPIYVVGHARERQDIVAPEIAKDPSTSLFLISTRSEEAVKSGYRRNYWVLGILGFICAVGGFVIADLSRNHNLLAGNWLIDALIAFSYVVTALFGWIWMAYNALVDLSQRVNQAWANVDVELKRRNDLIPNLVSTVKGLRDYEQNLQTEVATLRNQLDATAPGQTGPDHRGCAPILMAVAERYPELKAQPSFLNLQKSLSETEQRIALGRSYFNEIATFYNTRLQIIPEAWVSKMGSFKPRTLMTAGDFERAPVNVNFVNK